MRNIWKCNKLALRCFYLTFFDVNFHELCSFLSFSLFSYSDVLFEFCWQIDPLGLCNHLGSFCSFSLRSSFFMPYLLSLPLDFEDIAISGFSLFVQVHYKILGHEIIPLDFLFTQVHSFHFPCF